MSSYSELLRDVERSRGGKDSTLALLKHMRLSSVRQPSVVVKWAGKLVETSAGRLGDELWTVLEQLLVAALDVDDRTAVGVASEKLFGRFASGARASRLRGMVEEAKGEWSAASEIYAEMLEENGANAAALKREICVAKGRGASRKAQCEMLLAYLERFACDVAAWQALAELYSKAGRYDYAIFCYEELTLFLPGCEQFFCRLGELHYTTAVGAHSNAATLEAYKTARKYFAKSLELKPAKNVRAATCMLLTCSAVSTLNASAATAEVELNSALGALGSAHLKQAYKADAPELVPCAGPFVAVHAPPYGVH